LACYLALLVLAFQLKLEHGFVERIEQAGGLEIVEPGKIAARPEAEMRQEVLRRRVQQRPSWAFPAAGRA
jgi:hypothetical protein